MSQGRPSTSFLRNAAVHGVGNLLLYATSFILLPLYTHCLNPSEFGTLEMLNRIGEVSVLFLLFHSLRQAAITFYRQSQDDGSRQRVIGTTLVLVTGLALAGGVLLATAAGPLSAWLAAGKAGLLELALASALLDGMIVVLLGLAQARQEAAFMVSISISQLLVRIALCIVLVVVLGWNLPGVLLASSVTAGLFAGLLLLRELRGGWPRPGWRQLRGMAAFALPFLPCGLCQFILNNGDRFLLLDWVGPEGVGIYALGYKLAALVTAFSAAPLLMVWGPQMYDAARLPDAREVFGRVTTRILAAHLLLGLGVCLFQEELIWLLGGSTYAAAASVVAPVVLACWFLTASGLMDAGFYILHRTILKTWIILLATGIVLLLYLLLIPNFGSLGAAYATLGGYFSYAVITHWTAQRVFPVRYEYGRLAAMLGLAMGLWAISRTMPAEPWTLPIKASLWLLWPTLLWITGWVSPEEKSSINGHWSLVMSNDQ